MTEFDAYNYCLSQIKMIQEQLFNMGYDYDEEHGWYNYYGRRFTPKEQAEINDNIEKFKKYKDFSGMLRKKLKL